LAGNPIKARQKDWIMQYRKFGNLDWEVSVLGLGSLRLPGEKAETAKIIHYLIEKGVNYLDLGLPLDPVQHELAVRDTGQALKNGYRQKVRLALNVSAHSVSGSRDFERYLESHLKWLDTDRVDFLVLGGLNRETWPRWQNSGVLSWAEKAITSGKADKLGFAFHDQFQFLKDIIKAYPRWALAQFQYSFMDFDHHPGVTGLTFAAENGLAVVATEPLRGGRLTRNIPEQIAALWSSSQPQRPLYQWALNWVWNHPEICTAVVDIGSMSQAEEDVALAECAKADSLTVQEEVLVSRVRDAYRKMKAFPCTTCRSCMPCPQGIDAPRIFELYNEAVMFDEAALPRSLYCFEGHKIEACNECGTCVKLCGRRIDIPQQLKSADKLLRENKGGSHV
jgi:uncharacterized protein